MARCWSSQIWVIPTFSPTIALVATGASPSRFSALVDAGRRRSGTAGLRCLSQLLVHPCSVGTAEAPDRIGSHADAPLGEPERSARLVWSEVPADIRRALEHVLLTWLDPKS